MISSQKLLKITPPCLRKMNGHRRKKRKLRKKENCCKSKELEGDKEETKRELRGNSDDFYFMLIRPIYRLIVRRPKAFT